MLNPPPAPSLLSLPPAGYVGDDINATNAQLRRIIYGEHPTRNPRKRPLKRREIHLGSAPADPQATAVSSASPPSTIRNPARLPRNRIERGVSTGNVLTSLTDAWRRGSQGGIAFTVKMQHMLGMDDAAEIRAARSKLVRWMRQHLNRVVGAPNAFIMTATERCERAGLHIHVLALCPAAQADSVLDAIERHLARQPGYRVAGAFFRGSGDPWFRHCKGRITSEAQARGWAQYLLKSAIAHDGENGIKASRDHLSKLPGIAIQYGCGQRLAKTAERL